MSGNFQKMKALAAITLFCLLQQCANAEDFTALCRLFKDGTQLREPGSCTSYITCNKGIGTTFSCKNSLYYDVNKKSCVDSLVSDNYCGNRCENNNGKWIADPINCNGFLYCMDDVGLQGYCENNFHFNEKTQTCVYVESSTCIEVPGLCDIVADKTKFRDENNCMKYYECSKGEMKQSTCEKSTYFDVNKSSCVNKTLVECTAHPLPKNVCGTDSKPSPGFKSDAATCRGYFFCKDLGIVPDLEPAWGQCPEGTFFNPKAEICDQPRNVPCNFNRCESRGNVMVSSSSNNCRNYFICKNGQEIEERTCNGDTFFNEDYQACVPNIIDYPCCDEP